MTRTKQTARKTLQDPEPEDEDLESSDEDEEEQQPPAKRKLDFSADLCVLVGPEKKRYVVSEKTLTARSSFFKAACSKTWSGTSGEKTIELPDDEPETFENYLQAVYLSTLAFVREEVLTFRDLVRVHVLADKLGDLQTANLAIDQFISDSDELNFIPYPADIRLIFTSTAPETPLQRLVVDYYL